MELNTGRIFHADDFPDEESFAKQIAERKLVPLSDRQFEELKPMGRKQRKGYMRNQPCICGSGKKFKKCCWDTFGGRT